MQGPGDHLLGIKTQSHDAQFLTPAVDELPIPRIWAASLSMSVGIYRCPLCKSVQVRGGIEMYPLPELMMEIAVAPISLNPLRSLISA